jgi:uncharacterized membrane protein YhaH (DUF805 family)
MEIQPTKSDRPRVSWWIFVLAWLIGNFALIAGFEGAQGLMEDAPVLCVFAVACGVWWWAFRVSRFRNRGGFIVLALWMLSLIVPLLDFRRCVRDPFFWGSAIMLTFLAGSAAFARSQRHNPVG